MHGFSDWLPGLIATALPEALIIDVTRDPADTCLSCFCQDFVRGLVFRFDLGELGHYYRLYDGLMNHWRQALPPARMTGVRYEDLVTDFDDTTARLLAVLDLPRDPACAEFHRAGRPVRTASMEQVRQPLYATAIGQWRQYADHLGPLLDALGPLAPVTRAEARDDPPPTG